MIERKFWREKKRRERKMIERKFWRKKRGAREREREREREID